MKAVWYSAAAIIYGIAAFAAALGVAGAVHPSGHTCPPSWHPAFMLASLTAPLVITILLSAVESVRDADDELSMSSMASTAAVI